MSTPQSPSSLHTPITGRDSPAPHDLLWLTGWQALRVAPPDWLDRSGPAVVVVRRAPVRPDGIPVGIRGHRRDQRFAAVVRPADILTRVPPERLTREWRSPPPDRLAAIPALKAFWQLLAQDLPLSWGPTGSVGFELATGQPVASVTSDLDIFLAAPRRLSPNQAATLVALFDDLPARADVQVETAAGCFALREFAAAAPAPILLRTLSGPRLVRDPWDPTEGPLP
jgi:phosphoribosyl-dephospho-CoA transferase